MQINLIYPSTLMNNWKIKGKKVCVDLETYKITSSYKTLKPNLDY